MDNDLFLRAYVGEAEMLIFPSILLPERHQSRFIKKILKPYFALYHMLVDLVTYHVTLVTCSLSRETLSMGFVQT
jgi:hypothetical protein